MGVPGIENIVLILTDQLLNTLFICVCSLCPKTGAFVCIGAQQDGYLGEFAVAIAELWVLGDEDVVDCREPF